MLGSRSNTVAVAASPPIRSHLCRHRGRRRRPITSVSATPEAYDYIIVGGGSAGCLLANRLSEDDANNVLLLEAGSGKQNEFIRIPSGITRLFKSEYDWNLYSTPQKNLNGKSVYIARGKVIGGSSSTNATLYHRGTAQDYDDWGLDGWTGDDVLPWFKYAEDYIDGNSDYHRRGGLMRVEHVRYENQLYGLMLKYVYPRGVALGEWDCHSAARELGIEYNPDFNDWSRPQEGFGTSDVTVKGGTRADAYRQCLRPAMKRENLRVISEARATKVFIEDGQQKRAAGVEYRRVGSEVLKHEARLKPQGEVILCGGAIHSPHLLMLSGIGCGRVLKEHGIDVVQDLPGVGQHLQDHPAALSAFYLKPEFEHLAVTNVYDHRGKIKRKIVLDYSLRRRGVLSTTVCDRVAFLRTPGHDQPNIQIRFNAGFALDPDGVGSFVKFGKLLAEGGTWPGGITVQAVACRPRSEGSVTLASDDPLVEPAIDIGYFTDPENDDIQSIRDGLKFGRALVETPILGGFIQSEGFPGVERKTDAELDAYIQETVHSANAIVGTCRMGISAEDGSVVSSRDFGVHGVEGLRVVDSSVIPRIIGGQTGAPTVMIAERGAHMIQCNSKIC